MNATAQQGVSLQARDVCKSYDGQLVLKGIDFQVERGEVFVLMGPSGSGKTVLLKHLIGLEVPDRGEILIEGQPIHSPGVVDRYRLAMVFQSGALLNSLSVADNVGLYLSEHRLHPPETIARIGVPGVGNFAIGHDIGAGHLACEAVRIEQEIDVVTTALEAARSRGPDRQHRQATGTEQRLHKRAVHQV